MKGSGGPGACLEPLGGDRFHCPGGALGTRGRAGSHKPRSPLKPIFATSEPGCRLRVVIRTKRLERGSVMTWLQRYRVRHYVQTSIWIAPVLSMAAALLTVRVLHWIEQGMGWQ